MPKRMESEKPNNKRLRKASIIKNSLSLRVREKKNRIQTKTASKFSESDNDFSSLKDYSEEQGRKVLYFGGTTQ